VTMKLLQANFRCVLFYAFFLKELSRFNSFFGCNDIGQLVMILGKQIELLLYDCSEKGHIWCLGVLSGFGA
jgi:hypothetical protein